MAIDSINVKLGTSSHNSGTYEGTMFCWNQI